MNPEFLRTKGSQLIQNLERYARRTSKSLIQLAMLAGVVGYAFLGGGVDTANAQNGCAGVVDYRADFTQTYFTLDGSCSAVDMMLLLKLMGDKTTVDAGLNFGTRTVETTNIDPWERSLTNPNPGQPWGIKTGNEVNSTTEWSLSVTKNFTTAELANLLSAAAIGGGQNSIPNTPLPELLATPTVIVAPTQISTQVAQDVTNNAQVDSGDGYQDPGQDIFNGAPLIPNIYVNTADAESDGDEKRKFSLDSNEKLGLGILITICALIVIAGLYEDSLHPVSGNYIELHGGRLQVLIEHEIERETVINQRAHIWPRDKSYLDLNMSYVRDVLALDEIGEVSTAVAKAIAEARRHKTIAEGETYKKYGPDMTEERYHRSVFFGDALQVAYDAMTVRRENLRVALEEAIKNYRPTVDRNAQMRHAQNCRILDDIENGRRARLDPRFLEQTYNQLLDKGIHELNEYRMGQRDKYESGDLKEVYKKYKREWEKGFKDED